MPSLRRPDAAGRDGAGRPAGLEVRRDPAGNPIGTLPGTAQDQPALILGSHTATVAGGRRFDGPCGVMAAIEAVRRIRERGGRPQRTDRVVDLLGEEPNDFGILSTGAHRELRGP